MSDNTDPVESAAALRKDRRTFLAGAAGAAAVAATGGLISTPPAAAATWQYSFNPGAPLHPAHGVGLGQDFASDHQWLPGYGYATLPFPTDPGSFFSWALKTAFGAFQRCLCVTPQAVFALVGLDGSTQRCEMSGGVGVGVGGGSSNAIQQILSVALNPTEHISQGVNGVLGDLSITHDGGRKAPLSGILPLDPEVVFHQFLRLANPFNWPGLAIKFATNPMSIIEEFLRFFFPARQNMNFNINVTASRFSGVTLVNKATIAMQNPSLSTFPPVGAPYQPPGPVELVDINNPSGPVIVVINNFQATVSHRKGLPPQVIGVPTTPTAPTEFPQCSRP